MAQNEFAFEDWVREGVRGLMRRRKALLPEEFRTHLRAAGRETLLASRAIIDAAIERTEPHPAQKATRIKVE